MSRIRWLVVLLLLAAGIILHAEDYPKQGGTFSLGIRNTFSTFSDGDPKAFGSGIGGHFRLQVIDRVNTEWYADYITSNIYNQAHRDDYHIGWSVMYYLIKTKGFTRKLTPYVVAGHCFDLTSIKINGENGERASRFSTAVQAGIGCHYNITPKFDISLCAQYMLHLGKELDAERQADGTLALETHKNAGWEGHLLISLSMNYKIAQLWKPKK
jgi:hypothetical protein